MFSILQCRFVSLTISIFPKSPHLLRDRRSTKDESQFSDMSGLVGYSSSEEEDDQREADDESKVDVC